MLRGADCGTAPASQSRLQHEGGKTVLRRLLVRTALVAVLIGFIAAGFPAGKVVQRSDARLDPDVVVNTIKRYQRATWRWQRLMGVSRTPARARFLRVRDREYLVYVAHQWRRRAIRARLRAHNPPHEPGWRCLQNHEASWSDASDPYWGGLQMDRSFMRTYAPRHLLRRGWANRWTPIEQMWVAERAFRAGRGFHPWPNAARRCSLI